MIVRYQRGEPNIQVRDRDKKEGANLLDSKGEPNSPRPCFTSPNVIDLHIIS